MVVEAPVILVVLEVPVISVMVLLAVKVADEATRALSEVFGVSFFWAD